jgi:N-acetylglucosamine-6-phosphate deacetylase
VLKIEAALEAHGVTRWCPTVVTQDPRIVERNLEILGGIIEANTAPNIHGIHLEGHYISSEPGYRGVHMERYIRDPDVSEMQGWYRAARGKICLFSLAPERTGAIPFIGALKTMGVKVGLVHHRADYQTIRSAAAAGADLCSHLLNGCAKMVHRQHNVIWAQLSLDDLWASFIADGYHIPPYTLRALIRAKGITRSILISDLAHLSGLPEGEYRKYGNTVVLKDEGLWVKGEGTDLLSGAVKTLDKDCAYLASRAGFSLEDALIMASLNPARYFGIDDRCALYAGWSGKLVGFTWRDGTLKPSML